MHIEKRKVLVRMLPDGRLLLDVDPDSHAGNRCVLVWEGDGGMQTDYLTDDELSEARAVTATISWDRDIE